MLSEMKHKYIYIIVALLLPLSLWGQESEIITAYTDEGVEMQFTVTDESQKTCMVGHAGGEDVAAIDPSYSGKVTIPSEAAGYTVTAIGSYAFSDCELSDVVIPATVTSIGDNAFACDGINTVTMKGETPLDITSTTFYFQSDAILYVPIGCSNLFSSAPYWSDFGDIIEIITIPETYAVVSADGKTLTFFYDTNRLEYDQERTFPVDNEENSPLWLDFSSTITAVVFDPSFAEARPTSTYQWFNGMENLSFISGMEYLNTSEVTTMCYMFQSCKSLRSVELKYMETWNVANMSYMFNNCKSLKSIDLSNFDTSSANNFYRMFNGCTSLESVEFGDIETSSIENFSYMFSGCSSLLELDLSDFTISERARSTEMLNGCSSLTTLTISQTMYRLDNSACQGVGTPTNPCAIIAPEGFDFGVSVSGGNFVWKKGYFFVERATPYAVLNTDVLTFYYDNMRKMRDGQIFNINGWDDQCITNTKSVVFDSSFAEYRPTSTSHWFQGMRNLASIVNMENLNTSLVTDMDYMFYDCATLTDLNLDQFNTSNVGGVSKTFYDESSGGDDGMTLYTEYVCDGYGMSSMFQGCTNLVSLDLRSFDTSKVKNMSNMFHGCESLESLDVSSFNTSEVVDMTSMFEGCVRLESLDLSKFDISHVGSHPMGEIEDVYVEEIEHELEGYGTYYEYRTYSYVKGESALLLGDCYRLSDLRISDSMVALSPDACQGVGTDEDPCEVLAPENFDFDGVDTSESWFEWKSGYFHLGMEKSTLSIPEVKITSGKTADIVFMLDNGVNEYDAFQFDLTLPLGITLDGDGDDYVYTLSERYDKSGCTVMINPLADDTYRVVLYSLNNVSITGNQGAILTLRIKSDIDLEAGTYKGFVDNIVFNGHGNVSNYIDEFSFTIIANSYPMGDVNHDGYVNITDVMLAVNYIIGKNLSVFYLENADLNADNTVNISDVMAIVNIVIRGSADSGPAHIRRAVSDQVLISPNGKEALVCLENHEPYTALQMDVVVPSGGQVRDAIVCGERSHQHRTTTGKVADGRYRVVLYSMNGAELGDESVQLLRLQLEGCDASDVQLENIMATNATYESIAIASGLYDATGIRTIDSSTATGEYYDLRGIKVQSPTKGVFIRNGKKEVR